MIQVTKEDLLPLIEAYKTFRKVKKDFFEKTHVDDISWHYLHLSASNNESIDLSNLGPVAVTFDDKIITQHHSIYIDGVEICTIVRIADLNKEPLS